MIKGEQRKTDSAKYVGFTQIKVKAFNPSREELNALHEKENSDEDKELTYLGEDKEGNPRIRMYFVLQDPILNK